MARATLRGYFENQLTVEDVQALAPDILAAVKTPCPADTMFGNEIRMGGFKALTKYHFKEGIEAGVIFAKTQGGHGSESRTGEIMKEIVSYGTAAREAVPGLKELIVPLQRPMSSRGEFPGGELNDRRSRRRRGGHQGHRSRHHAARVAEHQAVAKSQFAKPVAAPDLPPGNWLARTEGTRRCSDPSANEEL